jgi:hypothetical protein
MYVHDGPDALLYSMPLKIKLGINVMPQTSPLLRRLISTITTNRNIKAMPTTTMGYEI